MLHAPGLIPRVGLAPPLTAPGVLGGATADGKRLVEGRSGDTLRKSAGDSLGGELTGVTVGLWLGSEDGNAFCCAFGEVGSGI